MITKVRQQRISDIPQEQLLSDMKAYGERKARTKKSARSYLRSVGMNIQRNGTIVIPEIQLDSYRL